MNNTNLEQLKAENKQLKSEQQHLFEQLNNINTKLKDSEAFKSHFLSNISNEIINPFTSILGLSESILELNDADIEQIHLMADLIHSEAFDLDFQLRNIFAAAKIESGENSLELVDLKIHDFINEIFDSLRLKAEKNELQCELTHLFKFDYFTIDADKLRIILINLIMNAITFSTKKNKIAVRAELNDDGFLFKINNQGKIISEEDGKIIFNRFIKLDNHINSLNKGHGLGLSIIKDYLDLLNGHIQLESNEKEGTTFSITLPPYEKKDETLFMEDEDLFSSSDTDIF